MRTPYTITTHQHRFAWAACRAASVKNCRFRVYEGIQYLAACDLDETLVSVEQLPKPENMDQQHRDWRNKLISAASQIDDRKLTHGIAAKLINVYLKIRFVCAWHHQDKRVHCLHPPIDSLLLDSLRQRNIGGLRSEWQKLRRVRRSKFTSVDYERANRARILQSPIEDDRGWLGK